MTLHALKRSGPTLALTALALCAAASPAFAQTTVGYSFKKRNADLPPGKSQRLLKSFRENITQIDDLAIRGHSQRSHNKAICSNEHERAEITNPRITEGEITAIRLSLSEPC